MGEPAIAWDEPTTEPVEPEDHRLHLRMLEAILFAAARAAVSRGDFSPHAGWHRSSIRSWQNCRRHMPGEA